MSLIALTLSAQPPSFEVASIKPTMSPDGFSSIRPSTGLITMENVSLKKLILNAYGIPDDRDYALIGPRWLATEKFDIQARFPADTPPQQLRPMLQTLLAERFKLVVHRETRQLPQYALVVSKDGPKIHPAEDGQPRTSGAPGRLEAARIPIQKLADLLGRMEGLPVTDETGLKGVFTFTLEWAPVEDTSASGPDLTTAIQEQLGLKLEGRKGPVEVLVVDSMEKTPTGN